MKISANWMQQLAGGVKIMPKGGINELTQKIGTQLGAVEEVIDLGQMYKGIIIAKVVSCEKHPNADKLRVCLIDDGGKVKKIKRDKDGYIQVVCGAPNVAVGQTVVWLPPGSIVPSSADKDPFTLEARELRGVVSNGMLASASELAISDDHNGIVVLDSGKAGDDFAKTFGLDDYIIDIENKMFTHRPDCFGMLGVTREIAGITHQKFSSPDIYKKPTTLQDDSFRGVTLESGVEELKLKIINELPELVTRFMALAFSDITVSSSPFWLQVVLSKVGIRPINNIVDLTNYYMVLTGQPLHAYDYDKVKNLSDSVATIVVRKPRDNEKLELLNGKTITPWAESILIATDKKAIGIGGVMGGADTEVDSSTRNIILECANFDMYSIRKSSMENGVFSDAVTRFNKGQSPLQCDRVLAWISNDLVSNYKAKIAGQLHDKTAKLKANSVVKVSPDFINERLGLRLTLNQMKQLLECVEFKILPTASKQLTIEVPFWRTDIEIAEDIVEEIGRLYGYDHLPLVLPMRDLTPAKANDDIAFKQQLRNILAKAGANEMLNYNFVHGNLLEKVGQDTKMAYQLSNAISPDLQFYRLDLVPSLLEKVHINIKAGTNEFTIFEINKAHNKHHVSKEDGLPVEFNMLALVYASNTTKGQAAYYTVKKYLEYLAEMLNISFDYKTIDTENSYPVYRPFDISRSANIYIKGTQINVGIVGEFKSNVISKLKLPDLSAGFEISIEELQNNISNKPMYSPISKYPKVTQDVTLKVKSEAKYSDLTSVLENGLQLLDNMKYDLIPIDIYQGEDKAFKNITYRLSIASYEKTLTDKEVNRILEKLTEDAKNSFEAVRI